MVQINRFHLRFSMLLMLICYFSSCIAQADLKKTPMNNFARDIGKKVVVDFANGRSVAVVLLEKEDIDNMMAKFNPELNEQLSTRFKSKIYNLYNILLHVRSQPRIRGELYESLEDFIACRIGAFISYERTGKIIVITHYNEQQTATILREQPCKLIPEMTNGNRKTYLLTEGKYMVISAGASTIYNSLKDLNELDPFDETTGVKEVSIKKVKKIYSLEHKRKGRVTIMNKVYAQKLLKEFQGEASKELSELSGSTAFKLINNKILEEFIEKHTYILFESEDIYREHYNILKKDNLHVINSSKKFSTIYDDTIFDNKQINFNANEQIETLATILHVDQRKLDKSVASVSMLDEKINEYYLDGRLMTIMIAPLIAYVGEIIRIETNGKWIIKYEEDYNVWVPKIVSSSGELFDFAPNIYDELNGATSEGKDVMIESVIQGMFLGKKLIK